MAERKPKNIEVPARFYRGKFHHGSVYSHELTVEQRNEYRATYRRLLKTYGNTWSGRMKARKMMRTILYGRHGVRHA